MKQIPTALGMSISSISSNAAARNTSGWTLCKGSSQNHWDKPILLIEYHNPHHYAVLGAGLRVAFLNKQNSGLFSARIKLILPDSKWVLSGGTAQTSTKNSNPARLYQVNITIG